jgi:hypothetical protein
LPRLPKTGVVVNDTKKVVVTDKVDKKVVNELPEESKPEETNNDTSS